MTMENYEELAIQAMLQEVAIHASSLWDGLVFGHDSDELFRIWGQGGIELHFRMADLAMADALLCDALFTAADSSFPGVYTYEVTEALGQMVAGHLVSMGEFPTEREWQTALGELALGFFERGNFSVEEMATLREVVTRQLPGWREASTNEDSIDPPPLPISSLPASGRPARHIQSST